MIQTIISSLIAPATGLLGVYLGGVIATKREKAAFIRQKRNNAEYAVIRILCVLDEYAEKCMDVVCDDGTSCCRPAGRTASGEEFYEPQVKRPEPPIFPSDIEWKSLENNLAYRILMLPVRARDVDRDILMSSEHSFPPGYEEIFDARMEGYAKLALNALELAKEIRGNFKYPQESTRFNALSDDHKVFLNNKIKEIQMRQGKSEIDLFESVRNSEIQETNQ